MLATSLAALVILAAAYYWPIGDLYHPLNTDWNGCSKISSIATNALLLFSYDSDLPKNSTLAIIGPTLPFTSSETLFIRSFLAGNGTVLLADDGGSGNSLLEQLHVTGRFSGLPLADIFSYSKNPAFPLVTDFSANPLSRNVSAVILDHASFLEIGNETQTTVLASSSPFSFIDMLGNGKPALNESVNSYPLMAYTHVGIGRLILISDPGMFINEVVSLYDNLKLFGNIVKMSSGSLIFDVAHLKNSPLTRRHVMLRNAIGEFASLALGNIYIQVVLVALVLVIGLPLHWFRGRRMLRVTMAFYSAS